MNSLQQLKHIRRLNEQRTASAIRALAGLGRETKVLLAQVATCEAIMQVQSEAIAHMRGEACPPLDRAAFFERKRREAILLAKRAEQRIECEYLHSQHDRLREQQSALQQNIELLHSKDCKWQKAERYFRRELNASQARIEDRVIEGNVLCKQLTQLC